MIFISGPKVHFVVNPGIAVHEYPAKHTHKCVYTCMYMCVYHKYVFSSVTQSSPILCNPMDCSTPGFPAPHQLQELAQTHSIELVMPSNHFILCHPLLPPSIFVSIRVFSNESALHIRWPKYWSFNFSISPFNSGLISFRID